MDQDAAPTRETTQEEERFWFDTERQFFANPASSLILCLRNHAWHCRYIARQTRQLLREHEEANANSASLEREARRAKIAKTSRGTSPEGAGVEGAQGDEAAGRHNAVVSVRFRVKSKGGELPSTPTNGVMRLPSLGNQSSPELASYVDDRGFPVSAQQQMAGFDDEVYYNPVMNAKHDGKLKLPVIFPSQAPDGIRILLYCPNDTTQHIDLATSRRPGFKTNMLNDMISPEQVPEIVYGPAPVWARCGQPVFKDGTDLCGSYDKDIPLLEQFHGPVVDPVWACHNDLLAKPPAGTGELLRRLALTDVSPPCAVDYSPKLFTFVEAKPPPICRRCLGMSKVACPICTTMEIANNIPGVCFSNPTVVDHKYEMVYNGIDIYKARTLMGEETFSQPAPSEEPEAPPGKRSHDDDATAVLKEYLDTLEEIDSTFTTLLERVKVERKPNYDAWSHVESQMVKSYIEQYNNKMMDNRYNYNTQRQSFDVLRIRLTCPKSANLPQHWTDHALCSVCGSDEDWDDDPILFCDCCYIPMHYCCLGYKPGTMSETLKQSVRRHRLLHTQDDDEPSIDEDEWLCPCCLFMLDQLAFLDEGVAMKAIRASAGPRNKQILDHIRDNPSGDGSQPLEVARLPFVVGFEYDNPVERVDLCTVYRRVHRNAHKPPVGGGAGVQSGGSSRSSFSGDTGLPPEIIGPGKLTLANLVEYGNTPTTMAFSVPDEDVQSPFELDLWAFEIDVLGRTISQFWSFKAMTKTQLEIAHDIFDDVLLRNMKSGNFDGMLELFRYTPKEEENTPGLIQHDRILQQQKTMPQKRGRKPVDIKLERPPHVVAAINAEVVRGPEQELVREDIYTLNCKNPLKKLVVSVQMARNFFVNLKIPICIFCGFDAYYPGGGPMKRTSNPGTWAHLRCAIAVECTVTPKAIDYNTFVPKVKALKCLVCHNSSTAIVQCSHGNCCKAFHVSCAAASSYCLFTWDQNGKPDILCPQHASGLAPTVLLRKLQSKVQYKNLKKMSAHETNLEGVNPKDDVYLTHLLDPNYRSVASLIEKMFNLRPRTGFPIPLCGDEVVYKQAAYDKESGDKGASDRSGEPGKTSESKNKVIKKHEVRLPLRDKSGKFKVADKNKDSSKSGSKSSSKASREAKREPSSSTLAVMPPPFHTSQHPAQSGVQIIQAGHSAQVPVPGQGAVPQETGSASTGDAATSDSAAVSVKQEAPTGGSSVSVANVEGEAKPASGGDSVDNSQQAAVLHNPAICRITKLSKEHCFWCSMGNEDEDEYAHYRAFYDDKCPTSEYVGSVLFPDLDAVKQKGAAILDNSEEARPAQLEGVPPLVWSEICASSRIVDEKMLSYIADDFIGGQRLISEVVSKSCRSSLLGLTRLLNIVYFKSKNGADMRAIFDCLLRHMKTMQSVDEARRNCEIGTNNVGEVFSPLSPMSPAYPVGHRMMHPPVDHRKECRVRVKAVLRTLNPTVFMRLEPNMLPGSILRMVGSKSPTDDSPAGGAPRHYVICSGCVEFKVIEQDIEEEVNATRKRQNYAHHYKTCRVCNARACSDCLSYIKADRQRVRVSPSVPTTRPPSDAFMSAATLLAQPAYPGVTPRLPLNPAPLPDEDRMPMRDPMLPLPLIARSPMIESVGAHAARAIGVGSPGSAEQRVGTMMAPNMQRGPLTTPSPIRRMMPRPPMVVPGTTNLGEMAGLQLPKPGLLPLGSPIPKGIPPPCIGVPMANGAAGRSTPRMLDRDIPGAMCGGAFGKVGPMIKSPPVKNGAHASAFGAASVSREAAAINGAVAGNVDGSRTPSPVEVSQAEASDDSSDDTFMCSRCEDMENDINLPLLCCALCSRFDGLLVSVNREHLSFYLNWTSEYCGYAYVHLVCLDWLTCSKAVGPSMRKFPKTLFEHPCHYCGVACGATIACANSYCSVRFHASCAAWLGCKVEMNKKPEGVSASATPRRVFCLRHTFVIISRMTQLERKYAIAPPHLYELMIASKYHLLGFYGGVYMSRYCVPNKMRNEGTLRPPLSRAPTNLSTASKRPKPLSKSAAYPVNTINATMNMISGVNYMGLGLVVSKANLGQPVSEYSLLSDNIARDRLIQALNWTAYHSMSLVGGRRDKKEIRMIIQMIKAGQLKPIHGSKRGRKPKSLDGSNFDNRQKMPMEDILTYCHSGQLDSGEFFCPVCFSIYFERSPGMPGDDLHWIGCDGCERWFHFVCAGVWADGQGPPDAGQGPDLRVLVHVAARNGLELLEHLGVGVVDLHHGDDGVESEVNAAVHERLKCAVHDFRAGGGGHHVVQELVDAHLAGAAGDGHVNRPQQHVLDALGRGHRLGLGLRGARCGGGRLVRVGLEDAVLGHVDAVRLAADLVLGHGVLVLREPVAAADAHQAVDGHAGVHLLGLEHGQQRGVVGVEGPVRVDGPVPLHEGEVGGRGGRGPEGVGGLDGEGALPDLHRVSVFQHLQRVVVVAPDDGLQGENVQLHGEAAELGASRVDGVVDELGGAEGVAQALVEHALVVVGPAHDDAGAGGAVGVAREDLGEHLLEDELYVRYAGLFQNQHGADDAAARGAADEVEDLVQGLAQLLLKHAQHL
ncbi:PHD-finger domain-containing protein [Babesia caballi]|uniref:PHD-finger domain-containing protein n=1 Tax=Babesia caballi TaxID=5871 RepID=A0AAV4LQ25_BABCB|nr:PHD-finger domain-containing protein [Babesia caballi]